MNNRIYVIPEWMLKTLNDKSALRANEVLEIAGYKKSCISKIDQIIESGGLPLPTTKSVRKYGKPTVRLWNFGEFKKFVEMHNKNISA